MRILDFIGSKMERYMGILSGRVTQTHLNLGKDHSSNSENRLVGVKGKSKETS